jgi:hypothetical protein
MSEAHLIQNALNKPDFKTERLLPLFPTLAHYDVITLNGNLALKIFLPNLPKPEDATALYPKYPGLPAKMKLAGQQVRFEYHDANELPTT